MNLCVCGGQYIPRYRKNRVPSYHCDPCGRGYFPKQRQEFVIRRKPKYFTSQIPSIEEAMEYPYIMEESKGLIDRIRSFLVNIYQWMFCRN